MFRRRDITEKRGSISSGNSSPDGARNMVVPRRHISNKRAKNIKRSSLAYRLLNFHIGANLVKRHMARPLNQNLHMVVPCALRQPSQFHQLGNLGNIAGIFKTARPAGVPQTDCHIVFFTNIQKLVITLIKRIFISGQLHPCKNNRAAAGYNVCMTLAFLKTHRRLAVDTAMYRHKIDAVFRVHSHNVHPLVGSDIL